MTFQCYCFLKICSKYNINRNTVCHLVSQGSQISFKALMFPLQSLNTSKVFAKVIVVQCFILLLNPVFSFIHITMETLYFMGRAQLSGTF